MKPDNGAIVRLALEAGCSSTTQEFAQYLDANDELGTFRDRFRIPTREDGSEIVHLAANRNGLPPKGVKNQLKSVMDNWRYNAIECHFTDPFPAATCEESIVDQTGQLVGAAYQNEVALMNEEVTNLHLLLVSFYRPVGANNKILIVEKAGLENIARSHIKKHDLAEKNCLLVAKEKEANSYVSTEDIVGIIQNHGNTLCTVILPAVHPETGYLYDMKRIAATAREFRCTVGFDLSLALGVMELNLHEWMVDYAWWDCGKFLGAGMNSVGCAFLHSNHFNADLHQFRGWWGHKYDSRFAMTNQWDGSGGINSYKLSNLSPIKVAQLKASLDVYNDISLKSIRGKSILLTSYLWHLCLSGIPSQQGTKRQIEIVSPADLDCRGAIVPLKIPDCPEKVRHMLKRNGYVCDFHEPDFFVICLSPLYCRFIDVYNFSRILLRDEM